MSCAPRPRTSPSTTSPAHGEKLQSARPRPGPCRRGRAGTASGPRRRRAGGRRGSAARGPRRASSSHSKPDVAQALGQQLLDRQLLVGRVGGVDPDQLAEQLDRLRAPSSVVLDRRRRLRPWLDDTDSGGAAVRRPARSERRRSGVPAAEAPLAVRMRPRSLDELVGQDELMRVDSPLRIAIESGRAPLGDPLRAAGHREDHARPDHRRGRARRVRGGVGGERRPGAGASGDRAGRRSAGAPPTSRRSSSSTRSTASTRPSRTRCCPRSRRGCSR